MTINANPNQALAGTADHDLGELPGSEALSLYLSLQRKGLQPYMVEESPGMFRVGYSV